MKESYRKGVANRPEPELCVGHRKVQQEALTGAQAGWVLSFENPVPERRLCGVEDPRHVWKLDAREPGDPGGACGLEKAAGRKRNSKGHSVHVSAGSTPTRFC